jgi:radical SAM protein with 4Fe4S-binding SPASM domain
MWKIGWGFTSKCNMNCSFCYSRTHRLNAGRDYGDIATAARFISRNMDKIHSINYGTGENTLEESWWQLLIKVHEIAPNIRQGLTTNGSLFSEVVKSDYRMKAAKILDDVDVSIDYCDPERHNDSRGHAKAFENAINTLDFCQSNSITRSIVMVATRDTFKEDNLIGMIGLARRLDANLRVNIYRPVGDETSQFLLPPDLFYQGLRLILDKMDVVSMSDPLLSALMGERKYEGDFTGKSSCRILENGEICPSTYLIDGDWKAINIYKEPDFDIDKLKDERPFAFLRESSTPAACNDCPVVNNCRGGAFDRRWLWYKSLSLPDPYCPHHPFTGEPIEMSLKSKYSAAQDLVHDGYLPTMIFR